MTRSLAILAACLALACGEAENGGGAASSDLTQRERDSILAQSRIPGARAVGKALRVADSVSARVQITDTLSP